jgi:hypothetical protein
MNPVNEIASAPEMNTKMKISVKLYIGSLIAVAIIFTYGSIEYTRYTENKRADTARELAIKEIKEVLIPAIYVRFDEEKVRIEERINYFAGPEGRTDRILKRYDERIKVLEKKGSDK